MSHIGRPQETQEQAIHGGSTTCVRWFGVQGLSVHRKRLVAAEVGAELAPSKRRAMSRDPNGQSMDKICIKQKLTTKNKLYLCDSNSIMLLCCALEPRLVVRYVH